MSDFLWGSATASYQCEGAWNEDGRGLSKWDVFCHSDQNKTGITGDVSCDFYHRYEEDIRMLSEGGQNAFRFSIAWPRILPQGSGEVNQQGVEFYKRVLSTCKRYNVTPFVTLYHWDIPQPLAEIGGWENRSVIDTYLEFAKVCFREFGHNVNYWTTFNEIDFVTMCEYITGRYPPHVTDFNRAVKVLYHMLLASARCVRMYKDLDYLGSIGLVHASANAESLFQNDAYTEAVENADMFFNKIITDPAIKGWFSEKLLNKLTESHLDLSFILPDDKEVFQAGTVDFLGINLYNRALVKPYISGESTLTGGVSGESADKRVIVKNWFEMDKDPEAEVTAWGSEIYPKCMYDELIDIKKNYQAIPVFITENGIGYCEELDENGQLIDDARIKITQEYVDWMLKAKSEGCNIQGYFIWSTMDLYSWINGYEKRYGLVYVDFENKLKRIPKKSYYWYKTLIASQGSFNKQNDKNQNH